MISSRCLKVLLLAYVEVNGDLLVKLRYLCSKVTRARVDNKVLAAVLVYVNLDKVVTAAKSAERTLKSLGILEVSIATELCEIKSLLSALPNVSAAGDEVRRLIHLLKINVDIAEVHGVHSATDIHTNHRGNDLVGYRHSRTNSTPLARVNVGHNSFLRGRKRLGITHLAKLLARSIIKSGSKALGGVKLSNYLYHYKVVKLNRQGYCFREQEYKKFFQINYYTQRKM